MTGAGSATAILKVAVLRGNYVQLTAIYSVIEHCLVGRHHQTRSILKRRSSIRPHSWLQS